MAVRRMIGAGRGLGLDIAKAALAAGHAVIATGREPVKVTAAIGHNNDLLAIQLDVTRLEDAHAAVAAAVAKFGRIDVLVNNAGNFYAGFFEELGPEQVRNQIDTALRTDERQQGGATSDAQAARRPAPHNLVDRGHLWPLVLQCLCRREVRR